MTVTRGPGICRFIAIARATIDHPCHIARPDIGRAPARSGVACPKNVQRQHLTCPSELLLGSQTDFSLPGLSGESSRTRNFCCLAGSNLRAKIFPPTIWRLPKVGGAEEKSFLTWAASWVRPGKAAKKLCARVF